MPEHHNSTSRTSSAAAILAGMLCVLLMAGVFAPRLYGVVPAALGVIFFLAARPLTGQWPKLDSRYLALVVIIPAFAALTSFWGINPDAVLERSIKIAVVLVGGGLLTAVLTGARWTLPGWFARALPLTAMAAMLICVSELLTHGLIYHSVRGEPVNEFDVSVMNRATISLVLLFLPVFAVFRTADWPGSKKAGLTGALLGLLLAMTVTTDSQSAQLAVMVMALFWFAFPYRHKAAYKALMVLVSIGVLIMPWAVQVLYNQLAATVHTTPWLSSAYAAERLEIWDFVARKALENPLSGFGVEATRNIEHFDTPMLFAGRDHVLHPHNAVLQVWIEFGVPGVLALCAFLSAVIWQIAKQPVDTARLNLSVLMAVLAVSCTSYGLWQGWWIGLFTTIAALCFYYMDRVRRQGQ